jgi:hypothetical protein
MTKGASLTFLPRARFIKSHYTLLLTAPQFIMCAYPSVKPPSTPRALAFIYDKLKEARIRLLSLSLARNPWSTCRVYFTLVILAQPAGRPLPH